ncbi:MAG: hypothetical protein JOZ07_17365 [Solirubrobacterales bacterium]|nr:hypothetical protein [Solirubrobacterales bacterium]
MRRLRCTYGARPLHLIGLVASFALAAAGFVGWFQRPQDVAGVLEWFVAAIVLHDLVLMPLYALLDGITIGLLHRRVLLARAAPPAISPTPYLRVPAMISALLFAVLFPVILGLGGQAELAASGIREHGYLARWLLACGALFALSGAAYTVARARARARAARGRGH